MTEREPTSENPAWQRRPAYLAVPLRPGLASHPYDNELDYEGASTDRIFWALDKVVKDMLADGRLQLDFEMPFREFVENSLRHSQALRLEHHRARQAQYDELEAVALDDMRVQRALMGEAQPVELLGLILDYQQLDSIELAKLSHPADFGAYDALWGMMHEHIAEAVAGQYDANMSQNVEFELHEAMPRYKLKTPAQIAIDEDKLYGVKDIFTASRTPLMTMVRKRPICRITTPHASVEIVERAGLLLRWDAATTDTPVVIAERALNIARVAQFVGNIPKDDDHSVQRATLKDALRSQISELSTMIETHLPDRPDWLAPTSTSYYAYRVAAEVEA